MALESKVISSSLTQGFECKEAHPSKIELVKALNIISPLGHN